MCCNVLDLQLFGSFASGTVGGLFFLQRRPAEQVFLLLAHGGAVHMFVHGDRSL